MRDSAVIILAAGQGKRMQSHLPKPLVPVLGRPILDHLLDAVHAAGIDEISVVMGHQAETMRAHLGASDPHALPSREKRHGTCGRCGSFERSVRRRSVCVCW